ncbi:MAG: hypothetical protein HOL22_04270 [Euryarchaeota archaeon]|jgi:hypothetical protein|nr:hypothetical protein [Euryarchaeota archaeon]MBT5594234.1 hypothetical protein [Euryarchaeota archaeon]MBT5844903.1 hypothetical protein [Euryarchaeota archaeon]MBT6640499.1 hypothetical protein [Euryarchaeota archaeon]MBT6845682.1 hypothetical protein [Euryarchaeota archaeon]
MKRTPVALLMTVLFSLSVMSSMPVHAQGPIDGQSWTLGWATDMDSTYIVEMDIDWDAEGEIVAYVENTRMTQLELDLTYEFDSWVPFTFSGPDTFSVAANGNETFSITFSSIDDDDAREYNPDNTSTLTIIAEEKVGDTSASTQELEGDVSVPRIFDLRPEVSLPDDSLHAGSWIEFSAQLVNSGNARDAVKQASVQFRSCPHLSMPGLEDLANTLVETTDAQNGKDTFVTLRLEASESQPNRVCEVTLTFTSEGDEASRSSTFEIEVMAVEVGDDTAPPSNSDDTNDSEHLSQESNTLPWIGGIELLMAFSLATLGRSEKQKN